MRTHWKADWRRRDRGRRTDARARHGRVGGVDEESERRKRPSSSDLLRDRGKRVARKRELLEGPHLEERRGHGRDAVVVYPQSLQLGACGNPLRQLRQLVGGNVDEAERQQRGGQRAGELAQGVVLQPQLDQVGGEVGVLEDKVREAPQLLHAGVGDLQVERRVPRLLQLPQQLRQPPSHSRLRHRIVPRQHQRWPKCRHQTIKPTRGTGENGREFKKIIRARSKLIDREDPLSTRDQFSG